MSGRNKRNLQKVSFTPITRDGDTSSTSTSTSTFTSTAPNKRPKLIRQATPHGKKHSLTKQKEPEEEEEEEDEDEDEDDDKNEEQEQQEETKSAPTSKASISSKAAATKPSTKSTSTSPALKPTSQLSTSASSSTSTTSSTSSTTSTSTPISLPAVTPSAAATTPRKVIILLIKSSLETIKTKRGYELVSADTHKSILQKLNKDPSEYRPDITHQCLLTLLDSPLNKAGHLQVYIQTEKNVLIEVNPSLRVPRTFRRFAGLMVQLLHKLKIRASDGSDVLLKVIKNPITQHLPAGAFKFGTSVTGELVHFPAFASTLPTTDPVVLVVGAHASGPAQVDWVMKNIAISQYGLSASVALGRICNAFENLWQIL